MYNFKPGGIRHRKDDLGGRPKSDADYSTKGRFDKKPRHDARGGDRHTDRNDRGGDRGGREMQLFQATCTTCGKSCEVPFRPDGTKPVLCRDCFAQKNTASDRSFGRDDRSDRRPDARPERSFDTPRAVTTPSVDISPLTRQLSALETKVSQLIELVQSLEQKISSQPKTEAKVVVAAKAAPSAKPKKAPVEKAAPAAKIKKEVVAKAPTKKVVAKAATKVAKKAPAKVAKKK